MRDERELQLGLVWVSNLVGLSHQSGHVSAQQGWTLPTKCFYGAIMTVNFDSGKMHHWANFIVRSPCQELLQSVI